MNNKSSIDIKNEKWNKSINSVSRISAIIAVLLMISVPLVSTMAFGEGLDVKQTILITGSILLVFAPTAIAENLSLYPILGVGGLILSVITGNVGNMKMPAAMSGMKIAETEIGTPEAEVVSILAVGTSAIVTTVIVFIGMLFGGQLMPYLDNPTLKPGFAVVLPALLGSLAVPLLLTSWKQTIGPLLFAIAVFLVVGKKYYSLGQGFIIITAMIIGVSLAYIMYKKGFLKVPEKTPLPTTQVEEELEELVEDEYFDN